MTEHAHARTNSTRVTEPSPLRGKLFDEAGAPLTPSHTTKSGRRYRYYISRDSTGRSVRRDEPGIRRGWRLPAREVERLVGDAVAALLADRAALTGCVREAEIDAERVPQLLEAARDWKGVPLDLVRRVELGTEEIAIRIDLSSFLDTGQLIARHVVPVRLRRRGVEMRLVLADVSPTAGRSDQALIKAVARARRWFEDLATGRAQSGTEIAKRERVTERYVARLIPLAFLAPEIVVAILNGEQPIEVSAETLTKRSDLPLGWAEQKVLLHFD